LDALAQGQRQRGGVALGGAGPAQQGRQEQSGKILQHGSHDSRTPHYPRSGHSPVPPCQSLVWNGEAGRPALFAGLGLAVLRQPKGTWVGLATPPAWTTTVSPSIFASAGTNLPSSPATSNSLGGLPSRDFRPPAVWAKLRRTLSPSTFIDLYKGPE